MTEEITTIKISKKTKTRLDNLKVYKHETYEEILLKTLEVLNILKANPEQARARLAQIDMLRKQIPKTSE